MTEFKFTTIDKGASTEITREKFSLDEKGITKWLINKNIISENEILSGFQDRMPWTRTGGETFCTLFEYSTPKITKQIFIKAIATMSPEKSLQDWALRRKILGQNGIPVSNWYYSGLGIIIEDFYHKTVQDVLFEKILAIGYQLDLLGFTTLKFTDDIRADKDDNPFFIDFGFDLGEPSNIIKTAARDHMILKYPDRQNQINNFYERQSGKSYICT